MSDHGTASARVTTTIDGREINVARDTWALVAARRLGIPIVVVSYDRTPGRASRLSALATFSRARRRSRALLMPRR